MSSNHLDKTVNSFIIITATLASSALFNLFYLLFLSEKVECTLHIRAELWVGIKYNSDKGNWKEMDENGGGWERLYRCHLNRWH